jgi:hypothetical protein
VYKDLAKRLSGQAVHDHLDAVDLTKRFSQQGSSDMSLGLDLAVLKDVSRLQEGLFLSTNAVFVVEN